MFQASYVREPLAFCRGCHAPLSDPEREPTAMAMREGVTCTICHADATVPRGEHHDPMRSLRTSNACASCHEFSFVGAAPSGRTILVTGEAMQRTLGEWRESSASAQQCQSCHMQRVRSHTDHRFEITVETLRRAVSLDARVMREGGAAGTRARLVALVGPGRVGHSFPTGDLFRRAALSLWREGDEAHAQRVEFSRTFTERMALDPATGQSHFVRTQSRDTRIPAPGFGPPDRFELSVAAGANERVHWRFDYFRTSASEAALQGLTDAQVRVMLFEGSSP